MLLLLSSGATSPRVAHRLRPLVRSAVISRQCGAQRSASHLRRRGLDRRPLHRSAPASATVHRPKVAVQFVEAGTDRKQAVALSLDLGSDVGVGVGLGAVPAVLPLIGGGALWEGPGLGDDQAPPRSSAVHEERVPHAGNSTALVRDAEASRSRTANRVRHPHFELMLLLLSSASQLWRTGRTLRHDPVREGERLCHPGRREPDCVHFREAGAGKSSLAFPLAADLGYSLVIKDLVKEALHDTLYVPGSGPLDPAWSQRLNTASWELLWTLAAGAGDMVIEANFHPHNDYELGKLRGLGGRPDRSALRVPRRGCLRPLQRTAETRGPPGDAAAVRDGEIRPAGWHRLAHHRGHDRAYRRPGCRR